MGFWNPRANCPSCGAKIHTQSSGRRTGTECPECHAALTGKVELLGKKAILDTSQSESVGYEVTPDRPIKASGDRLEQLERLMRLRDGGMITDAELEAEKAKLDRQEEINDIVLLSVADDDIVPVIKVVQEFSDFDLKKSLQLVRSAPVTILSGLDGGTAESARARLEQAGAQVRFR
jgi:ribosomal protein L7/L12